MNEFLKRCEAHELAAGCWFWLGYLPQELMPTQESFEQFWSLHPRRYHEIKIRGRLVKTPRWQQAFGRDYHYSGRANKALPVPPNLEPFLRWGQEAVDPRLNGILLNWYDGTLGHYIGRHRDSIKHMVPDSPIVTISLGDERTFRLRPWPANIKAEPTDFPAHNGAIFVMPWKTNLAFTHEVPTSRHHTARRISVTLRAFLKDADDTNH